MIWALAVWVTVAYVLLSMLLARIHRNEATIRHLLKEVHDLRLFVVMDKGGGEIGHD